MSTHNRGFHKKDISIFWMKKVPYLLLCKCIVRRMKQHSSEAEQCINEIHPEEDKGGKTSERGHTRCCLIQFISIYRFVRVPSNVLQLPTNC